MRLLFLPLMLLGSVAFSQTIVVQKCVSSAFEEPTFVTVPVDTATKIQSMANGTQPVNATTSTPLESQNNPAPPAQVAKAKKED